MTLLIHRFGLALRLWDIGGTGRDSAQIKRNVKNSLGSDQSMGYVRDGEDAKADVNRYFIEPVSPLLFGSVGVPSHRTADPERMLYNGEIEGL
jgi:hypothetical protein